MLRRRNLNDIAPNLGFPSPQNSVKSFAYAPDHEAELEVDFLDLALSAIKSASKFNFEWLKPLNSWDRHLEIFPGEHYRLLAGFMEVSSAERVCEIGTFKGFGSLALWAGNPNRRVTTFDILSLEELDPIIPSFALEQGFIIPRIADLAHPDIFEQEHDIISKSQVIFLDGPKNGQFEYDFLVLLAEISFDLPCYLIIDDIRFLNMIPLWRGIRSSKMDLTSFGHWSGTGIVKIQGNLLLDKNFIAGKSNG